MKVLNFGKIMKYPYLEKGKQFFLHCIRLEIPHNLNVITYVFDVLINIRNRPNNAPKQFQNPPQTSPNSPQNTSRITPSELEMTHM